MITFIAPIKTLDQSSILGLGLLPCQPLNGNCVFVAQQSGRALANAPLASQMNGQGLESMPLLEVMHFPL